MSEFTVQTSAGSYVVVIEEGAISRALPLAGVVLIDDAVTETAAVPTDVPTIVVTADETLKTLGGCEKIAIGLRSAGATRGTCLFGVGGGCVQDAATLVASLYMRGIPWIYAPTTLMAMLDSCIGGKSSINVGAMKNLMGNIYPPVSVRIDPSFATTLTPEMVVSGLAEAVKICFAGGPDAFDRYLELAPDPARPEVASELIEHVLGVKRWFIETDEFDRAERLLLNFGHTFGHALEAAVGFSVPHGVGVAVGMRAAIRHPASGSGSRITVLDDYCADLLAGIWPSIAGDLAHLNHEAFRSAFGGDTKHSRDSLTLVLPSGNSTVPTLRLAQRPRTPGEIDLALSCLLDVIGNTR